MSLWVVVTQEMTFGLGRVKYSNLYLHDYVKYHDEHTDVIVAALGGGTAGNNSTQLLLMMPIKYSTLRSILLNSQLMALIKWDELHEYRSASYDRRC